MPRARSFSRNYEFHKNNAIRSANALLLIGCATESATAVYTNAICNTSLFRESIRNIIKLLFMDSNPLIVAANAVDLCHADLSYLFIILVNHIQKFLRFACQIYVRSIKKR